MKIETLKERIEKKEAQIQKKQNTITKKQAQIQKKQSKLEDMGFSKDVTPREANSNNEAFWLACEISNLRDDIKRNASEIEECKVTLAKYEAQLKGEMEKEALFIKEVPEAMKTLEAMLIDRWDEDDKKRRAFYNKKASELGYKEFVKAFSYSAWEYKYTTDEQIHNSNVRDARYFILDLLNRVKDITGEVTDWSYIHLTQGNHFPVLNGFVTGKEGKAEVESILAGGYNIQRLHIRTLVKAC